MPEYGIHNYVKCKKAPEFVTEKTRDKSFKAIKNAAKAFENNETLKKLGWNDDFQMFTDKFIEFVDKDPNIHRITSGDAYKRRDAETMVRSRSDQCGSPCCGGVF